MTAFQGDWGVPVLSPLKCGFHTELKIDPKTMAEKQDSIEHVDRLHLEGVTREESRDIFGFFFSEKLQR